MKKGDLVILKPGLYEVDASNPLAKVGTCTRLRLSFSMRQVIVRWSAAHVNMYFFDDLVTVKEAPNELHRET